MAPEHPRAPQAAGRADPLRTLRPRSPAHDRESADSRRGPRSADAAARRTPGDQADARIAARPSGDPARQSTHESSAPRSARHARVHGVEQAGGFERAARRAGASPAEVSRESVANGELVVNG